MKQGHKPNSNYLQRKKLLCLERQPSKLMIWLDGYRVRVGLDLSGCRNHKEIVLKNLWVILGYCLLFLSPYDSSSPSFSYNYGVDMLCMIHIIFISDVL